jgi:hypothetical protein
VTNLSHLQDLEQQIRAFSPEEQLWLIERLADGLRANPPPADLSAEALAAMASDPEIQQERRAIEHDFAVTQEDGLEKL